MATAIRKIQQFVYQAAKQRAGRPVPQLMRFVGDSVVLEAAWKQVARKGQGRTSGDDGLCAADIHAREQGASGFLHELAVQLETGRYEPGPVRRFEIAKNGNPEKKRKLAVLTLADRVVHTACKLVLEPIVEARLGKRCYGFRAGRCRHDELTTVRRCVQSNPDEYAAALTTDIASCFDYVDHNVIRRQLERMVDDAALMRTVNLLLRQVGSGNRGFWGRRPVGLLQGSALSPILANLALAPFDEAWSRAHGSDHPAFRYADDLLILADSPRQAGRLRREVAKTLWRHSRMKLSKDKTQVFSFSDGVPILGMIVRSHQEPYDERRLTSVFVDHAHIREILTEIDVWSHQLAADLPLGQQFRKLNQKLRGWFQSLQFAYDAPQAFTAIDYHVFRVVRARLKELLNCTVAVLQQDHHVVLPSGHETWSCDGEHLMLLGTLRRRQFRSKYSATPWNVDDAQQATHSPSVPANNDDVLVDMMSPTGNGRRIPFMQRPTCSPPVLHAPLSTDAIRPSRNGSSMPPQNPEA